MANFVPQFGKSTTLSAQMTAAEVTSGTLAAANFTDFTADFLVIDYDVPAKREVIKCNVTGTAIASITRAQEGTSAVQHEIGAKVGYNFVPSHYTKLNEFLGARAYLNATLGDTVASDITKVALDAESYDVGADFATSKYTAPVNGYYSINSKITYTATADKSYLCYIYKSGSELYRQYAKSSVTANNISVGINDMAYLTAGEYIELYYFHDAATTTDIVGGAPHTFLAVTLLKEA